MVIEFDPNKRALTLANRGLDMADAEAIFDTPHLTVPDNRVDYGEDRFITIGHLGGRMIVIVWTPRWGSGEPVRRIISMRKANEREQTLYGPDLE